MWHHFVSEYLKGCRYVCWGNLMRSSQGSPSQCIATASPSTSCIQDRTLLPRGHRLQMTSSTYLLPTEKACHRSVLPSHALKVSICTSSWTQASNQPLAVIPSTHINMTALQSLPADPQLQLGVGNGLAHLGQAEPVGNPGQPLEPGGVWANHRRNGSLEDNKGWQQNLWYKRAWDDSCVSGTHRVMSAY